MNTRKKSQFANIEYCDDGTVLGWFRGPDCTGGCVDWDFIEYTQEEWELLPE